MRDYTPIWNQLKKDKVVSVAANTKLHSRIVKAVKKEKYMDIGYKLSIDPAVAIISHVRETSKLTFKLRLEINHHITERDI